MAGFSAEQVAYTLGCSYETARRDIEAEFAERYRESDNTTFKRDLRELLDAALVRVMRKNMEGLGSDGGPQSRFIIEAVKARAALWGLMAPMRIEAKVQNEPRVSPLGQYEPFVVAALCNAVARGDMASLRAALQAVPEGERIPELVDVTPKESALGVRSEGPS